MTTLFIHLPTGESYTVKIPPHYGKKPKEVANMIEVELNPDVKISHTFEVDTGSITIIKQELLVIPHDVFLRCTFSIREV